MPALLLLFVGSGCAALIYEIVWLQLLQLVIGSSAVSLGVLLGTFMGGMCLGSLALARIIPERVHPLRVYALLEGSMAVLGLAVLFAVPVIGRLYAPHAGHGLTGILLRGVVASVCLLPPTLLMGATLPAVSRWVETTAHGMSWLGLFYGGNTLGAVIGCLLAGFYLLRKYDMVAATGVAAGINAAVALTALVLASRTAHHPRTQEETAAASAPGAKAVYVTIALSGFCALAAEVIWTRWLSLMLGATVYAFSIILAVFLAGLGLGSTAGSLLARGCARPQVALGWCQMLLAAGMAWAAFMLTNSVPYWPVNPSLAASPWYTFQLDLVRCLWALLPATILWGASFPLALAAAAARGQDPGRLVGKVYAANTVGAIIGALAASLVLIAWVGTQQTQRLLIALSALSGFVMLVSAFARRDVNAASGKPPAFGKAVAAAAAILAAAGAAVFLVWSVQPVPWKLVAHGRYLPTYGEDRTLLYMGEGMNASVAVTEMNGTSVRNFHVSGKIEASTGTEDMRLQLMLGHLPALIHPHLRSVLVVGCGAGITAGTFLSYPEVTNVVICEIEPLIPAVVANYFKKENDNVVNDPRVRIVIDDARHFVLTTQEKFDIITSDPIHPWVKGAATLYTEDYFEMCKRSLNPGGFVTQWVPLYESDLPAVQSELATFFAVFPNGALWNNPQNEEGYDTVLLGSAEPLRIDLDMMEERWHSQTRIKDALNEAGFGSVFALLSTYGGSASDLESWLAGAQINRDANLRLQYLEGLSSTGNRATELDNAILERRTFPGDIFIGDAEHKALIHIAIRPKKTNQDH